MIRAVQKRQYSAGVAANPERLAAVLSASDEDAWQRCAEQIRAGAPLHLWESASVTADHLAGIYSARAEHVRRISLPVVGIEDAVLRFQDFGSGEVTLATVEGKDGYDYHLFIGVDDADIVACIGTPRK